MSKKHKQIGQIDFHTGIGEIIPSTQQAYHQDSFSQQTRKAEGTLLTQFKLTLGEKIDKELSNSKQFPSKSEIFVFIVQFFVSEKDYGKRDIDNMAKTILDVLKGRFYEDDSQVNTLLITKKRDKMIPQNFAYFAIKELKDGRDVEAVKSSVLQRSISLYQELKSKGYL